MGAREHLGVTRHHALASIRSPRAGSRRARYDAGGGESFDGGLTKTTDELCDRSGPTLQLTGARERAGRARSDALGAGQTLEFINMAFWGMMGLTFKFGWGANLIESVLRVHVTSTF